MSHEPRRPQYGGLARIAEFHGASITAQGVGTGDGCPATNAAAKFGFSRTARPAFTAFALERQETSERLPDDWKLKLPPNVVISRYSPCTSAGLEPAAGSSVRPPTSKASSYDSLVNGPVQVPQSSPRYGSLNCSLSRGGLSDWCNRMDRCEWAGDGGVGSFDRG